jgi:hypothetical protein
MNMDMDMDMDMPKMDTKSVKGKGILWVLNQL